MSKPQKDPTKIVRLISQNSVLIALVLLIVFGNLRYENFLGTYNVLTFLRYNSMFALVSLGMCFVIISGGIDLSVGTTAALGSVVSALLSPFGLWAGLAGGGWCRRCYGLPQWNDHYPVEDSALHFVACNYARRARYRLVAITQSVRRGFVRHRFHCHRTGRFSGVSYSGVDCSGCLYHWYD